MSLFKINWGDMLALFKNKFATEEENLSSPTYFEDEERLILYMETKKGNVWCSAMLKEEIEDFESIKLEILKNATELTEPIKDGSSFVITQV